MQMQQHVAATLSQESQHSRRISETKLLIVQLEKSVQSRTATLRKRQQEALHSAQLRQKYQASGYCVCLFHVPG